MPFDRPIHSPYAFWDVSALNDEWETPGPMTIVPPGYSMRVSQNNYDGIAKSVLLAVTFYYTVLQDRG